MVPYFHTVERPNSHRSSSYRLICKMGLKTRLLAHLLHHTAEHGSAGRLGALQNHTSSLITMEIADLGMMIEKKGCELVTSVYRKPTNNGLLLHFQSQVDMRYKKSLIRTMLHRLSSSWESIVRECDHLKGMFFKLGYPDRLVDATITSFLNSVLMDKDQVKKNNAMSERNIVRVVLPFKDQRSADFVRKQLKDLGNNIGNPIQTVFTSPKIGEQLQIQERKPPVVSRQCVFYQFKCDLYDTDYIGYTTRHLHQRIEEHRASAVGTHVKGCHGTSNPELLKQFSVLKKCQGKLDCLIREMLFIRERKPKPTHKRTQFARKYLFITFYRARTNSLADVTNHLILNLN